MVMEKTFNRLGKGPTHTLFEFEWLCAQFPERIYVDVAYLDNRPVAGIGFFAINRRVNSSFYLCLDQEFRETQAETLLIYEALIRSQEEGFKWFDFGTSSVNQEGRGNIFQFKESFGAIGLFRETYVWRGSKS
jgi:lipid II:glycine glycyltransferase (peptidoglycan interpeptide bridge formation enzyme)